MLYFPTLISFFEVILILVPALLAVAYVTVAERKTMASMQRRLGPNVVGYYGLLQAFADALKLLLKEYVAPTQSNIILFFFGPVITLIFSLLGWAVIPYNFNTGFAVCLLCEKGIFFLLACIVLLLYCLLKYCFNCVRDFTSVSEPRPEGRVYCSNSITISRYYFKNES